MCACPSVYVHAGNLCSASPPARAVDLRLCLSTCFFVRPSARFLFGRSIAPVYSYVYSLYPHSGDLARELVFCLRARGEESRRTRRKRKRRRVLPWYATDLRFPPIAFSRSFPFGRRWRLGSSPSFRSPARCLFRDSACPGKYQLLLSLGRMLFALPIQFQRRENENSEKKVLKRRKKK